MTKIPGFINTQNLRIVSAYTQTDQDGRNEVMKAADGENDRIIVTRWTENTGAAAVMADTSLEVSYQKVGDEAPDAHAIDNEEADDLYLALEEAPQEPQQQNFDSYVADSLIGELRRKAGYNLGGAGFL